MADNVEANAGSGGATFASDDILGVQYPRAKVVWGADGTATDTSAANPLPVVQTGTHTVTVGTALPAGTNNIGDIDVLSIAAGDNNIGNVDIVTVPAPLSTTGGGTEATALRVTVASDSTGVLSVDDNGSTLSIDDGAGSITVDVAATASNIGAKLATDAIMNGTTALTPKFAIIDAATSGNNTLVAAVASAKIRVLACFMVAAGAVNARFESGADGTALSGQMNLTTNSGFVLPFNPVGWFETASNTLLNLELSGAVSVDGSLVYVEV